MGQSIDYLLKRERECREAAEKARDAAVRQTHLEFANRYASEAEQALVASAGRAT